MTLNTTQLNTTHLNTAEQNALPGTPEARLTAFLEVELDVLGYELVALDILNHREKKLCIYIDLKPEATSEDGVSIEDCVKVTRELDAPLEGNPVVAELFKGAYELEVSSPGIDRPLRKPSDFTRFEGEIARLLTFRPLTAEETGSAEYSAKNPKQKNFYGILRGYDLERRTLLFGIIPEDGTRGKGGRKTKTTVPKETLIRVPHELVAKANLEREIKGL
ncbi:MAG: ribosome maturation factor RimP [Proteobacteria bacterium]|nr:ribosome maturation factor RimP [Pseudomonadota bacterium]